MKKILEVSCNGLTKGGVQQVMMNIVRNLNKEYRFDMLIFTNEKEYYQEEFLSYGGEIFRIPRKKTINGKEIDFYYRGFNILIGTYNILKKHGPYQAIHCHNYFESSMCLLAAKLAGVKIRIVHAHNDLSNVPYSKSRLMIQKIYKKIMNKCATKKIGCSKKALEYMFDSDGRVIYNGINLEKFNGAMVEKKSQNSKIQLLHVGNFSPQKNQLFLIKIMKQLIKDKVKCELILVGGKSDYYNDVVELIDCNKLKQYVEILPQDSNVPEIMSKADLFLFPSNYEGLGIVLIEAQAMGLHCIVSDAIPEEADLGNLEYIDELDEKKWVNKIKLFIDAYSEKKKVDMNSYDIKNICKEYKKLYQ